MPASLISTDLHLTEKPLDEYRWGLFPWIIEQANLHNIENLLLLGDLTDAKDLHPASLTNRLVDTFTNLLKNSPIKDIICLRGNHDYIDINTPFFRFLNSVPGIRFIVEPTELNFAGPLSKTLFLPNSRDPSSEWARVTPSFNNYNFLFMHQTLTGSVAENGMKLTGVDRALFSDSTRPIILSGDVHVPQSLDDRFIYVGAPYHVHFGDKFKPRCLLVTDKGFESIHYKTIERHSLTISSIEDLDKYEITPQDQVKIEFEINDMLDCDKHRNSIIELCREKNIHLCKFKFVNPEISLTKASFKEHEARFKTLSPEDTLKQFCELTKVSDGFQTFAKNILKEYKKTHGPMGVSD